MAPLTGIPIERFGFSLTITPLEHHGLAAARATFAPAHMAMVVALSSHDKLRDHLCVLDFRLFYTCYVWFNNTCRKRVPLKQQARIMCTH